MCQAGLKARGKRRFVRTTDSRHSDAVADNHLARSFDPNQIGGLNRVWAGDITYLWTREGWLYLAVLVDLYSRRVVGWALDERLSQELTHRSLQRALALRRPQEKLLHHSDRGSQYTAGEYREELKQQGLVCSMSRKGNCWDNAPIESFFASLKKELVSEFN
jgi:transposase InsO family protein